MRIGGEALEVDRPRIDVVAAERIAHESAHGGRVGVEPVPEHQRPELLLGELGAGETIVGRASEEPLEHLPQTLGQLPHLEPRIGNDRLLHAAELLGRVGILEEPVPDDELVQDDPRRVDVAPVVVGLAPRLLGRHVCVLPAARLPRGLGLPGLPDEAGDAEVEELHLALEAHHHVVGRDVAVDEVEPRPVGSTAGMGVAESAEEVRGDVEGERQGHRSPVAPKRLVQPREVAPEHVLHCDVVVRPYLAEIEDLYDVGVAEAGTDLRLPDEHRHEPWIVRQIGEDPFDDEPFLEPLRPEASREEHLGHPARRDAIEQLVLSESGGQVHSGAPTDGAG